MSLLLSKSIGIDLEIDRNNQWFAFVWVKLGKRSAIVRFKIDTGCNALVLSHKTLKALGYSSTKDNLSLSFPIFFTHNRKE